MERLGGYPIVLGKWVAKQNEHEKKQPGGRSRSPVAQKSSIYIFARVEMIREIYCEYKLRSIRQQPLPAPHQTGPRHVRSVLIIPNFCSEPRVVVGWAPRIVSTLRAHFGIHHDKSMRSQGRT